MVDTCLPTVVQSVDNLPADLKNQFGQPLKNLAQTVDNMLVNFVSIVPPALIDDTALNEMEQCIRDLGTLTQQLAANIDSTTVSSILLALSNEATCVKEQATFIGPNTLSGGVGDPIEAIQQIVDGAGNVIPSILQTQIGTPLGIDLDVDRALTELEFSEIRSNVSETISEEITRDKNIIDRAIQEIENCTDCIALNAITQSNLEALSDVVEDITKHCGELAGSGAPGTGGCDPLPLGLVIPYAGVDPLPPKCYLLCDGSSYSTTGEYADLFKVISYTYGGSGGSFKVPDMRSRFPLGVSNNAVNEDSEYVDTEDLVTDTAAATLGGKGGREKRGISVEKDLFQTEILGEFIRANKDLTGTEILLTGTAQMIAGGDDVAMKGATRQLATIKFVKSPVEWDEGNDDTNDDNEFVKIAKEIKTLPPYLALNYVIKAKK
jgi:hypothetical protein